MAYVKPFLRRATRRRPIVQDGGEISKCHDQEDGQQGEGFKKCLTTFDLVSLGVGSCCGAGMYLTVGLVANGAGMGGALSFVIAGFGSLLSGLCYAELAALCPRTSGSAYMYSYVTVGELVAFVIGWGLLVEYAIGTAASAVALSAAVDTMSNYSYGKVMTTYMGAFLGRPYFDVIAVLVCLTLTLVLTSGVKLSATFNNILNLVNFIVFLIFCGCSIILIRPMLIVDNGFFSNRNIWDLVPNSYSVLRLYRFRHRGVDRGGGDEPKQIHPPVHLDLRLHQHHRIRSRYNLPQPGHTFLCNDVKLSHDRRVRNQAVDVRYVHHLHGRGLCLVRRHLRLPVPPSQGPLRHGKRWPHKQPFWIPLSDTEDPEVGDSCVGVYCSRGRSLCGTPPSH
ncbi:probable cationic amino acid transporter isoform X2 [Haliotis rubra]|uniref:probable cationic amino acid transporter isoform X2 n=1 Tax=Haliotis rubra TaxID=36100 RepID=UPI001EE5FB06|nr:probable cationic amino acid transporter isoform X2 [Haliotis rubra]XP_046559183.1 probable cationic amino acid transporter isoform X2 [Haliotis rubra]XP_046559184.1 probable cationic amino acid transporter isoform X2 [Haliotis rubra]